MFAGKTPLAFNNLALFAVVASVPEQLHLLRQFHAVSTEHWDTMRDKNTRQHLIEGVTFSTTKGDGLKTYVETLSKVVFDSKGGWQRGFTVAQISEQHREVAIVLGKLNNKVVNHNDVFVEVMTVLFGYDLRLVKAALNQDETERDKCLVEYFQQRFDIVAVSFDGTLDNEYFEGRYPRHLERAIVESREGLLPKVMGEIDQTPFDFFVALLDAIKPVT